MLRNTLDLFDAMVSLQIPWKVDRCKEVLYLPCIPASPNRKPQVYSTQASTQPLQRDIGTFYKDCNQSIKRELMSVMFPYINHINMGHINLDLMEREFFRRLKRCGEKMIKFGLGKMKHYANTVFCMFPPAFA